jgi:hypothetical protein
VRTLIAAAVIFAAGGHAAKGKMRFGFNDDKEHILAAGNLVKRSGAAIIRVPIHWPSVEPQAGVWEFEKYDTVYRRLREAGVKPLFVIHGTPRREPLEVLPESTDPERGGPRDEAAWQTLWRTLAGRYPTAKFQVWNEPNLWPYGSIKPRRMARLTNLAAAAVNEVRPRARIVGPAPGPNGGWRPYAKTLYRHTSRKVDVGVHIYPRVPTRWRQDFRSDLRFAKRLGGARRLWITETGLSRYQYGRALQKRGSRWIVDRARQAGVASVIFHRLVPRPGAGAWDRGLAVTDRRLRPLPVFRVLRRAAVRTRSARSQ